MRLSLMFPGKQSPRQSLGSATLLGNAVQGNKSEENGKWARAWGKIQIKEYFIELATSVYGVLLMAHPYMSLQRSIWTTASQGRRREGWLLSSVGQRSCPPETNSPVMLVCASNGCRVDPQYLKTQFGWEPRSAGYGPEERPYWVVTMSLGRAGHGGQ